MSDTIDRIGHIQGAGAPLQFIAFVLSVTILVAAVVLRIHFGARLFAHITLPEARGVANALS